MTAPDGRADMIDVEAPGLGFDTDDQASKRVWPIGSRMKVEVKPESDAPAPVPQAAQADEEDQIFQAVCPELASPRARVNQ